MSRLEFGRPQDAQQALLRLPDKTHKRYWFDQVVEHLAGIKEAVIHARETKDEPDLEQRRVELKLADMIELESISFRRRPVLTAAWWKMSDGSRFAEVFKYQADSHRWWQLSHMTPDAEVPGYELVCVETNSEISGPDDFRFDQKSRFMILLLNPEEEAELAAELTEVRTTTESQT